VFLAWAPLTPGKPIPDPSKWHYQVGANNVLDFKQKGMGNAKGMASAAPIIVDTIAAGGELSVTYISEMRRWLLTITNGGLFIADQPWGPFTAIGTPTSDASLPPPNIPVEPANSIRQQCSGLYGNYIVEEYTDWDTDAGVASVYMLSSLNCEFYGVYLLRLRLSCG
jgi:hypothetical protein